MGPRSFNTCRMMSLGPVKRCQGCASSAAPRICPCDGGNGTPSLESVPDAPGVSSQSQSVDLMVGALADDSPDRPPRWMGELDGVKDQIASDESNLEVEAKDVQCVCGFVQEFDRGLCSGLGSGQAARKKERKKERGEKQMEEKRKSHIGKGWQGYSGALQARSK